MDFIWQQVVNGLTVGGIYALIALGYTMVYGVMKMINFAHGDLCALGAFVGLTVLSSGFLSHVPGGAIIALIVVFALAIIVVSITGTLLERIAYRPLRKANRLSPMVSALGASMLIENGMMVIWGPNVSVFPAGALPEKSWVIGGASISFVQILIIFGALLLMAGLHLFVNHTRLGTAIRAAAIDQDAARLMGINVNRVIGTVFVIGPALGAVGGLFIGLYYHQAYFTMGWSYGLNAFIAAILGGIGNIPGAMLGGLLLGLVNAFGAGYISSSWQDAITFGLLIAILIVRPSGLLGERVANKV
ncbi:branched-chain amino acid ABC transporter permease [Trinickia mobilis]|uniref:branched-chain amino acid ABC transporter permease n=1 Tax=Trinickia mobilis TaxID=2816356 RepID=UPI001A8EDC9B|nr:branched-chain amino acid ABC transporter permease [Trinickia mobilis]